MKISLKAPAFFRGASSEISTQVKNGQPRLLYGVVLAIIFEGALRKWLLPGWLQPVAYLAKDVLAIIFIFLHPIPRRSSLGGSLASISQIVGALLLPAIVLGFSSSVPAAVMTLKNAVLWPLFAAHLVSRLDTLQTLRIERLLFVCGLALAALSLVQYGSPGDALINNYAWDNLETSISVASFGSSEQIRATGTFSYITGFACFSEVLFCWAICSFVESRDASRRLWALAAMASAVVCCFTSGSRAPLVYIGLASLSALFVVSRFGAFLVLGGGWAVLWLLVGLVDPTLGETYLNRWRSADDNVVERISGEGLEFLTTVISSPLGEGLGARSQLASYQKQNSTGFKSGFSEDGRVRAGLEAGLVGIVCVTIALLFLVRQCALNLLDPNAPGRIGTATIGLCATVAVSNCLWFDHNATALWWLSIAFWLWRTQRRFVGVPTFSRST